MKIDGHIARTKKKRRLRFRNVLISTTDKYSRRGEHKRGIPKKWLKFPGTVEE